MPEHSIQPKTISIFDYFDKNVTFVVPSYQREYSWDTERCDQLLSDIKDFEEDGQNNINYFFGTIIENCQDGKNEVELIDGQQRTTTFLLLLKALLIVINKKISNIMVDEDSTNAINNLKTRRREIIKILYNVDIDDIKQDPDKDADVSIFKKYKSIYINKSINENDNYSEEMKNILSSYDYDDVSSRIFTKKNKAKVSRNKHSNYFNNFKKFYDEFINEDSANINIFIKTFLTKCEIIEIKSWNEGQAIAMFNSLNSKGVPLSDANIISSVLLSNKKAEEIKNVWKQLLEDTNDPIDIDSLLTQYMYYLRAKNNDTKDGSNLTVPGLRRYFININNHVLGEPKEFCENLKKLNEYWKQCLNETSIIILLKLNKNAKLFLPSFLFRDEKTEFNNERKLITECLLRLFAVLEIVDSGYSSKNFKSFLFKEQIKFINDKIAVYEIVEDFDKHIKDKFKQEDIKDNLFDYKGNSLVFLYEYLIDKDLKFDKNVEIEHIMPQSGQNTEPIMKDAGCSNEDFSEYVNKLGNKILLEEEINKKLGNAWFQTKVNNSIKEKLGYKDSKYPMAKFLVSKYKNDEKPYWTKTDIEDATNEAIEKLIKFIFNT